MLTDNSKGNLGGYVTFQIRTPKNIGDMSHEMSKHDIGMVPPNKIWNIL